METNCFAQIQIEVFLAVVKAKELGIVFGEIVRSAWAVIPTQTEPFESGEDVWLHIRSIYV